MYQMEVRCAESTRSGSAPAVGDYRFLWFAYLTAINRPRGSRSIKTANAVPYARYYFFRLSRKRLTLRITKPVAMNDSIRTTIGSESQFIMLSISASVLCSGISLHPLFNLYGFCSV